VRYQNTVFGGLLKALPRRRFATIADRHGGDKYVKGFSSWDHLVTLVFGQLGGLSSLREVETVWNAQAVHHYHLGSGPIRRSTLSDANRRRPSAIFAEVFAELSALAAGALAGEGRQVVRLIDATPIPLSSLHKWAEWNGRTRGLKTHVTDDPEDDRPVHLEITAATVNDVLYRKRWQIELLFRWIKQHLKIRTFLGRSENAIRLQILAALIAFLLLRIAARDSRSKLLALRFADLVRTRLFEHRSVAGLDKPPPTAQPALDVQNQLTFAYA
jgi:hypothetical protein